jgi:hypothetical protein
MSKKYGFGLKLAVAALAVAGVVGIAVAAPPTGDPNKTAQLIVGYEVVVLAEITTEPFAGLNADILKSTDAKSVVSATGSIQGAAPGTLGTVKVKTNASNWDVKMRTKNGGRLIDETTAVPDTGPCPTDSWGQCTGIGTITFADAEVLTYVPGTSSTGQGIKQGTSGKPDTVLLEVAIGVANLGKALNAPTALQNTLFALGGPSAPVEPVLIGSTDLLASNVIAGATGAISFADSISDGTSGKASAPKYSAAATTANAADTGISERKWSDIKSDGFGVPTHAKCSDTDECRNEEYFFVNVGINQGFKQKIGSNKGGTYTETLYFDLVASF